MARVVNEAEHILRRNQILDVAQRMVYTMGYDRMSIQHLIDELKISKGAFYHYFDSKQQVLEALVERTMQEAIKHLTPITQDPNQPALVKLKHFFDAIARWKTARKTYLMALLKTWYDDKNILVRQKMTASGIKWFSGVLSEIIQQGAQEGVFDTPFPEQTSAVAISMMMNMGDAVGGLLLSLDPESDQAQRSARLQEIKRTVVVYNHAIERVLGAAPGSILLFDPDLMDEWVNP